MQFCYSASEQCRNKKHHLLPFCAFVITFTSVNVMLRKAFIVQHCSCLYSTYECLTYSMWSTQGDIGIMSKSCQTR